MLHFTVAIKNFVHQITSKDGHREVANHAAEDDVVGQGTPSVAFCPIARLITGIVATLLDAARELKHETTSSRWFIHVIHPRLGHLSAQEFLIHL